MESKITQKCNLYFQGEILFKRENRLNHLFSHTGIIETLSRIIYTAALRCCFSYFVQPTENPRWKLWEHFCICKIIIVNRKVLQIWKLWPQFICLYFGILQFNWERREAIAVYFLSTNFLSIKVLINILKFPDDVTSSPSSSLWIHHPQVSIPWSNCLAR